MGGFLEEFKLLLGGKWVNLRKTDFTAVNNLKTLWLFCASCGPVHNKGVLQDAQRC